MRKIVIVILMIIVAGIVAFYAYNEFHVREITYVNDYESEEGKNRHAVHRLYSSDVDFDKYNELMDKLISLEFTEEEIMRAALDSGTPEFYPVFRTSVAKDNTAEDILLLRTRVMQEVAEGQERTNFRVANLRLEVVTNGLTIKDVNAESLDVLTTTKKQTPLIKEEGKGMTVSLNNYGNTEISFEGLAGEVVLQYVYDIESVSLMPQKVMEDCFIRVNVRTSLDADGKILAEYSVDKATTVEDYISGGDAGDDGEAA